MMMKNEKGYVNKGIDWLIDQDGEEQGAYAPPPPCWFSTTQIRSFSNGIVSSASDS